ncbi:hypothetical protein [Sphingopyxis sp. FD7]|jgi:hypothetical protein|uniref:hypothetical protein n=1 Tax=Sphingopyxis sp. FD7 TaxID=1914525 RepID=UPI001559E3C2|nr:hypothetical protein [Sphingopyxis sp. FD7]
MAKRTNLLERNAISSVGVLHRLGPRDDVSHAMTAFDAFSIRQAPDFLRATA